MELNKLIVACAAAVAVSSFGIAQDVYGMKTIEYKGGAKYVGEVNSKGVPHGQGKKTTPAGNVYEGTWVLGDIQRGSCKFASGSVYNGDFVNCSRDGKGRYVSKEGWSYDGEWKGGKKHGHGSYTDEKGKVTEGEWREDEYFDEAKDYRDWMMMAHIYDENGGMVW